MSRPSAATAHDSTSSSASPAPRVLFLVNDLRMGGAERTVVNLMNHGRDTRAAVVLIESAADLLTELRTGHELYTLDGGDAAPMTRRALEEAAARAPRRRRGQPPGRTLLEIPSLFAKARRLAQIADSTNAAVISSFLNRSHTIALLSRMVFARQMRVVINVHEMLSDHLERHFSPLERRFMRRFIRHAFPLARAIVAVSDGVKQDLVTHFSIAPERIAVVPNPLDGERIRRASRETIQGDEPRPGTSLIVSVGRLVHLKGFDLLIRAFAKLRSLPSPRLLIIGEGDQRPELETLIAELNVADRVALLGAQTNPWKYMARADVVALASRSEAFPNVIGEALALSRPVIATECSPGVAEYLGHGRFGMLVPPNDVDALATGLDRMLSDGALRSRFASDAPSRVESFEVQRIADRYETLLLEAARR
jgi:glycosyltransferase involved in cell wall biosynthesis